MFSLIFSLAYLPASLNPLRLKFFNTLSFWGKTFDIFGKGCDSSNLFFCLIGSTLKPTFSGVSATISGVVSPLNFSVLSAGIGVV